jgi:hypothetical protein
MYLVCPWYIYQGHRKGCNIPVMYWHIPWIYERLEVPDDAWNAEKLVQWDCREMLASSDTSKSFCLRLIPLPS